MTELREILQNCLLNDSDMTITIICNIPKLTLRINDSRQMIYYGIGQNGQHGFTLNIDIENKSKKGKKLLEKLKDDYFLNDFKVFEYNKSNNYLKDYGQEIEHLENAVNVLLNKLNNDNLEQNYKLDIHIADEYYTLE